MENENQRDEKRMILNPNRNVLDKILNCIFANKGFCPCQVKEGDKNMKCPCSGFIEHGICHCSLFIEESN